MTANDDDIVKQESYYYILLFATCEMPERRAYSTHTHLHTAHARVLCWVNWNYPEFIARILYFHIHMFLCFVSFLRKTSYSGFALHVICWPLLNAPFDTHTERKREREWKSISPVRTWRCHAIYLMNASPYHCWHATKNTKNRSRLDVT